MAPADLAVNGGTEITLTIEALFAFGGTVVTALAGYKSLQAKVAAALEKIDAAATQRLQLDARIDKEAGERAKLEAAQTRLASEWQNADAPRRLRKLELARAEDRGRRGASTKRITRYPGEDTIG